MFHSIRRPRGSPLIVRAFLLYGEPVTSVWVQKSDDRHSKRAVSTGMREGKGVGDRKEGQGTVETRRVN